MVFIQSHRAKSHRAKSHRAKSHRAKSHLNCALATLQLDCQMEKFTGIQCPFCGQTFAVAIDTSCASQQFTMDCEICCRPFEVVAECEPGEILSVDIISG